MSLHVTLFNMQQRLRDVRDDDQRMVCRSTYNLNDHAIKLGNASIGVIRHGETQTEENNRIRQELLNACKIQFGVDRFAELPKCVRDAFKVGVFKDDMKLRMGTNGEEQVTSGRPLTARRIKQVIAAVESALETDCPDTVQKAKRLARNICDNHPEVKVVNRGQNVIDYFFEKAESFPEHKLHLFDAGVDMSSFMSFSRAIYEFETTLYDPEAMPDDVKKFCDGGAVGGYARQVFSAAIVGRLSETARKNLAEFINEDACTQPIFDEMNKLEFAKGLDTEEFGPVDYASKLRPEIARLEGVEALDINEEYELVPRQESEAEI